MKIPEHRDLSGGDLAAHSIHQLGVKVAFGIHGGHLDAFLVGCEENGIRLVDTRHEATAVQAAQAYAHVTQKLGVAFVTANSGFGNSLPGIATALADRAPVLIITSSPPIREAETNCLQGFLDQQTVAHGITKFAHRILQAEEIPRLVSRAARVALSGAPGPVVLDFPIDILFGPVQQSRISWGSIAAPLPYPPGPNRQAITEVVNLWRQAKRPAVITGTGCRSTQVAAKLTSLLEATQTPVFFSLKGFGAIPFDHLLQGGLASNLALLSDPSKPDLIILLGTRTGMFLGGRSGTILPTTGCRYAQVDIDGAEIGRQIPVDVGIISDVHEALVALSAAVSETPFTAPSSWRDTARSLKQVPNAHEQQEVLVNGKLHPYYALKEVFTTLDPGAIVCIDGGEAGSWSTDLTEAARPFLTFFSAGYLGMLGNGWGYALGAAVADPSRQVVNVQGDGSAGFYLGELDTFARHGLNILTVVMNNHVWGMSLHGQDMIYSKSSPMRPVSTLSPRLSFKAVAEGLGMRATRAENLESISPTVREICGGQGGCLLELLISDAPTHPGTTAMVGMTENPDTVVVPYYDNVPRPYFKGLG